jgi:hypothetical protein
MVKKHSSEAFYAFDALLEPAVFSMVEIMRESERAMIAQEMRHVHQSCLPVNFLGD